MEIYEIQLTLTSFFNSQGVRRGNLIDVIRNSKGEVFIPGSQVKGIIRCEAERIVKSLLLNDNQITFLFGKQDKEDEEFLEPKLRFADLVCINKEIRTITKTGLHISRSSLSHSKKSLFEMILIPPGTKFKGRILCKQSLTNNEKKLLMGAIQSAAHYGFGSNRSRGLGGCSIEVKNVEVG